jgi:hypothetical protein
MITKVLKTTDTRLDANEEWVSAWYEEPWSNHVHISALADQPGTIYLEQSEDASNVLFTLQAGVSANVAYFAVFQRSARYVRLRYRNGASPQTRFRASITVVDTVH